MVDTGDVQFICLERKDASEAFEDSPDSPSTEVTPSRRSSSSAGTTQSIARKRIIYAHSDILKRRSDYFATMLNSSFAENLPDTRHPGERKVYTITVEEADFVTIYWLLKWVYGNWLLFKEEDDPKAAVEGVGAGWSVKSIGNSVDEWAWKSFNKSGFSDYHSESGNLISDTRSAGSGESAVESTRRRDKGKLSASASQDNLKSTGASSNRPSPSNTKSTTSGRPPPSPTRRSTSSPANAGNTSALTVPMATPTSPSTTRTSGKPVPVPISTSNTNYPTGAAHFPVSPRQQRQRSRPTATTTIADPHPHPTPAPLPASALAMYQVAHRYQMPGLTALALEHMMSTITPQTSFALLLATAAWEELHSLVEVTIFVYLFFLTKLFTP